VAGYWITRTTHTFAKIVGGKVLEELLLAHGKEGYFKRERVEEFGAEGSKIIPWFKDYFVPTNNNWKASLPNAWQQRSRQCCGILLGDEEGVRDELARFRDNKVFRPLYDMATEAVQFGYVVPLEEVQIELDSIMITELAGQIGCYVTVNENDPTWMRIGMSTNLGQRLATHHEYGFAPYLVYVTGDEPLAKKMEGVLKIHIEKGFIANKRPRGQKSKQDSHWTLCKRATIEDVDKLVCDYLHPMFKKRCSTR